MIKKVTLVFGARRLLYLKNDHATKQFFMGFSKTTVFLIVPKYCSSHTFPVPNILWYSSTSCWETKQAQTFHILSCNALLYHQLHVKNVRPFLLACQQKWDNNVVWEEHTSIAQFYLTLGSVTLCTCHCVCLFSLLGTTTAIAKHF